MSTRLNRRIRRSLGWMKFGALFVALLGCSLAEKAWAQCNAVSSDINLGKHSSFHLDNNSVNGSGSAGMSCDVLASLLSTGYIGLKVDQVDHFLRRDGTDEPIPFILSWSQDGPQIPNGTRIDNLSATLIGLLITQNTEARLYARTTAKQGLKAGTYSAEVSLTWYWSICLLLGLGCDNSTDDLRRNPITTAITNYGSGQTRTLTVTLEVTPDCKLSVPTIDFGQAALTSQFPTLERTIDARCTAGQSYKLGIGNGENHDGTTRRMKNGSHYLAYDLWKGTSGKANWGNSELDWRISSEAEYNPELNGIHQQGFSFRAEVKSGQTAPKGIYRDMVTVNLFF